jgi:hypothetical protein
MPGFAAIYPNHARRPAPHFGPFLASLAAFSLTQPNHGHFGTVTRIAENQYARRPRKARWFERAALRRGAPGSNDGFGNLCPRSAGDMCVAAPLNPHSFGRPAVARGGPTRAGGRDRKPLSDRRQADLEPGREPEPLRLADEADACKLFPSAARSNCAARRSAPSRRQLLRRPPLG